MNVPCEEGGCVAPAIYVVAPNGEAKSDTWQFLCAEHMAESFLAVDDPTTTQWAVRRI